MFENEIERFVSKVSDAANREVELRIHARGMMHKGVPYDVYTKILEYGGTLKGYTKRKERTKVVTGEHGGKQLRMIINKDKSYVIQMKKKLRHYDNKEYNFRIAEADEIPMNMTMGAFRKNYTRTSLRDKYRTSFVSDDVRLDVTKVIQDGTKIYEVEIEILKTTKSAIKKVNNLVVALMKIVQKSDYVVSNSVTQKMLRGYASLASLRSPLFIGPLPYTFSKNKFDNGALSCGYTVTDKADGVRYLLYVDNNSEGLLIGRANERELLTKVVYVGKVYVHKNTILDGELVGNHFYVFDCVVYNKSNVSQKNLNERLVFAKVSLQQQSPARSSSIKMSPARSSSIKMSPARSKTMISIKMKKFSKDVYPSSAEIWSNRKSLPYMLDGLIYTPIYKPYYNNNIYKWKDVDTVDFMIIKKPNNVFKLHIAGTDRNNVYTHFDFKGFDGKGTFMQKGRTVKLNIPSKYQNVVVTDSQYKEYPDNAIVAFKFSDTKD